MDNQNSTGGTLKTVLGVVVFLAFISLIQGVAALFRGEISAFSIVSTLIIVGLIAFVVAYLVHKHRVQVERENSPVEDLRSNTPPYIAPPAAPGVKDNWPDDYHPGAMEIADAEKNFLRDVGYHRNRDQYARFLKALDPNTSGTIQELDTHKKAAAVLSSTGHGIYHTSLYSCTCVDFQRRKAPCKHIYKLALELGVITPDWDLSGASPEMKEKLDQLRPSHIQAFRKILEEHRDREPFVIEKRKLPTILIKLGFFTELLLYDQIINEAYNFTELREAVKPYGIKGKSREILMNEIMKVPEVAEALCSKYYMVQYSDMAASERDSIEWYVAAKLR